MSAIPKSLVPMPKPRQVAGIKSNTIELSPTNGSLTTTYNPLDRIIFQIPAYPNGFLDVSKSYLRFKPTLTTDGTNVGFADGIPLFERMIVKSGSGAILEDIQDVDLLENLLEGVKEKSSGSARGALDGSGLTLAQKLARQNGKNITKRLCGGVFGEGQEYYIPLHLMGGPYALEVELVLNSVARALVGDAASGLTLGYTITNLVFVLEVVNMPEDVCKKLDSAICGGEAVSVPFSTYRSYRHTIPQDVSTQSLQIHEVSPNVEQVWMAMQKVTLDQDETLLLDGGSESADNKLAEYQFRYADRYMPLQPAKDLNNGSSQALEAVIKATGVSNPAVCELVSGVAKYFSTRFFVVQDFQTDKDLISGVSTQAHAGPIETFLKFSANTTEPLRATHFAKTSQNINVSKDGVAGLGMVM